MPLLIPRCDIVQDLQGTSDFAQFARNGFLIVKQMVSADLVGRLASYTQARFWNSKGQLQERRYEDEWKSHRDVLELATLPSVLSKLEELYGRRPKPFQTLNFPIGTEQRTHSDTIHFHTFPQRFMCGVWVAFEQVNLENGALHYYPGSHRLPILESHDVGISRKDRGSTYPIYEDAVEELISATGLKKQVALLAPGDVLIWAANLLHGGEPILRSGSTRMSQVTHYFFEGCRFYTPLLSDIPEGEVQRRNPQFPPFS